MGYQENLFDLGVMQDRSARLGGRLKLPVMQRRECEGAKVSRREGEQSCPFTNCRYHLVGEAMRANEERAVDLQIDRWEGKIKHTCTLDFAELDEGDDGMLGDLLGIERHLVPQRVAEAAFKMRGMMAVEFAAEDAFAGIEPGGDNETAVPAMSAPKHGYHDPHDG